MNFFSKRRRTQPNFRSSSRRSHRFAPGHSLAPLEARQLLAAGPLGVNLDASLGFVDVMKENAGWTSLSSSSLSYDANGWPLADASVLVFDQRVNQPWNGPDNNAVQPDIGGTYHLSFTGKATVTPDWLQNYTVQNQVYNPQTNTTTADLVVAHNSLAMLYVDFRGTANPASASGAGVSNVQLIQPGYAANTTQVFTTNMLNALSPFDAIRYLNVDSANSYAPTTDSAGKIVPLNWSQRKLPGASSQTTGPGAAGEAWEYMVALANATNTDMWINVPGPATDDYVRQLASLIKNGDVVNGVTYAGLKPGLKVYLEDSNEVWGGIWATTSYNNAAAKQEVAAGGSVLNADGTTDPNVWAQRYYLERSMQITNDFRSVFGPDPSYATVRPILAWQEGSTSYYNTNLPWFEKTFGAPNADFYGLGNANYANPSTYSTVDGLIASLSASIDAETATTAQFSTLAAFYGMKNVAYEGGPQTSGAANPTQGQVALAAARDPRMEDLEARFYRAWYAAGGDLAATYDGPFGIYSPGYQWSLAESSQASNPSASAKYRGMVDLRQAAPTPVTAGTLVSASGVTTLPIKADSFGNPFTTAWAGQANTWLVNVPTAGTYTLGLQTNAGPGAGQVVVSTSDTTTAGTIAVAKAAGTYSLPSLVLHAGLNAIGLKALVALNVAGLALTPTLGTNVLDPGFETVALPAVGFAYDPAGSPWTFNGSAGVAGNNSAFTNPNAAPQGVKVAFLQYNGSASQVVNLPTAGYYQVGFAVAQRAGYGAQTLQILVDGALAATYTTSPGGYQSASTPTLMLAAGQHSVVIQGTVTASDVTALIDNVSITAVPPTAVVADPSFEALGLLPSYNSYVYDPTGLAWTFAGQAGISANGTAFTGGNPAAPQGVDVAFLQGKGSASQVVANWAAGSYTIGFSAAQRGNAGVSKQAIQVLVDGASVGTFAPSGTSYQAFTTASFTVGAGSHTVTFQGTNSTGDNTAFLDGVLISQVATTTAVAAVLDGSFEGAQLAPGQYLYDPTGTAWTFTGASGTSANASGFTAGNPNAPLGTQVAFLQYGGAVAQSIANWAAGSYTIGFTAAQRGNYGLNTQAIQVLVDGASVGTFAPSGTSYQAFTTASFTVGAGSHTITFQGTSVNGDNTAFLDAVTINPASAAVAATLADSGFEAVAAPANGYVYNPTGGSWAFAGQSGLTANASNFTSSNPAAPQGVQAAFLQNQGTISQTFSTAAAGNYAISLKAAQRANLGTLQSFQVLLDGVVLSTFANLSTAYTTLTTATFALTAGSHTIAFQGLNASGDATAFLDDVNLVAQ